MDCNKQYGMICPACIRRKRFDLNYVKPDVKPAEAVEKLKPPRVKKPAVRQNMIKIRLCDNPKDIVIKFADKETLLKSLREVLNM